jgi:hypothetical protein
MDVGASSLLIDGQPALARPIPNPASLAPLSEAHFALLRRALTCRQPVRKAARTARFSAFTILVIGVAGIPVALFSPSSLSVLAAVGICTVGIVEYAGARRMQRGEVSASRLLGTNQLAFLGLIAAYCVTQMVSFSAAGTGTSLLPADMQSQLSQLQGLDQNLDHEMRAWAPLAACGFYSLVLILSVVFQGGLAIYYFTRRRHLLAFAQATPDWVQRLFNELGV